MVRIRVYHHTQSSLFIAQPFPRFDAASAAEVSRNEAPNLPKDLQCLFLSSYRYYGRDAVWFRYLVHERHYRN